jgi:hypothetical protein
LTLAIFAPCRYDGCLAPLCDLDPSTFSMYGSVHALIPDGGRWPERSRA